MALNVWCYIIIDMLGHHSSVQEFYDGLAAQYHMIFADWRQSVTRQGRVLADLLQSEAGPGRLRVLDCTCGIGTQAIGLALNGHSVTARDISRAAVERAMREAVSFGASIDFRVADILEVNGQPEAFDVVLSCDNSLAHFRESDLKLAVSNMWTGLRPGGLFLASIRDYDQILSTRPGGTLPTVFETSGERRIVFQVWDWQQDGRTYVFHLFILKARSQGWEVSEHTGSCRAVLRSELQESLFACGFRSVRWIMPDQGGYYQPIVLARR